VFATGKKDTAIFQCRTGDNPFLPYGFTATVRQQYTTAHAAQELEGLFVDTEGALFKRDWFAIVDKLPPLLARVRAWDLAATPKDEAKANDPDWTCGLLMGKAEDRTHYVLDLRRMRGTPQQVQALVKRTAEADGREAGIYMEQEPGSAGAMVIDHYLRLLAGFNFHGQRSTGSKTDRALPLAAQAEGGAVKLLRGPWNKDFLDEVELFPFGRHDDAVDAAALAMSKLVHFQICEGVGAVVLVPCHREYDLFSSGEEFVRRGTLGALGYGLEGGDGWPDDRPRFGGGVW
jgi:predicted phage terminase large subunit-like protein